MLKVAWIILCLDVAASAALPDGWPVRFSGATTQLTGERSDFRAEWVDSVDMYIVASEYGSTTALRTGDDLQFNIAGVAGVDVFTISGPTFTHTWNALSVTNLTACMYVAQADFVAGSSWQRICRYVTWGFTAGFVFQFIFEVFSVALGTANRVGSEVGA